MEVQNACIRYAIFENLSLAFDGWCCRIWMNRASGRGRGGDDRRARVQVNANGSSSSSSSSSTSSSSSSSSAAALSIRVSQGRGHDQRPELRLLGVVRPPAISNARVTEAANYRLLEDKVDSLFTVRAAKAGAVAHEGPMEDIHRSLYKVPESFLKGNGCYIYY